MLAAQLPCLESLPAGGRRCRSCGRSQLSRTLCWNWSRCRSRRQPHSGEGQHAINLRLGDGSESRLIRPYGIEAAAGEREHQQRDQHAPFVLALRVG